MTAAWNRVNTVILLLVLFALLALIGVVAREARGGPLDPPASLNSTDAVRLPGTPISGQFTINTPGHYYLTRDVNVVGAAIAITINVDNVSLDLGGFTVDGTDFNGSWGIYASARNDITVTNGTIKDFQFGIDASGDRARIDGVRAVSNVRGFHLGSHAVLTDCVASQNSETGIYVPGTYSTVRGCVVVQNGGDGIATAGPRAVVEDTVSQENVLIDIRVASGNNTTVRDNTVNNIRLETTTNTHVVDNICVFGSIVDVSGFVNFQPTGGTSPHDNADC